MTTPTSTWPTRHRAILAAGVAAALLLASCGRETTGGTGDRPEPRHPATLHLDQARIDWPPNPDVAAIRVDIDNGTDTDDTLLAVSTPAARGATLHRSGTSAEGQASMEPVDELPVPARDIVELAPGGLHVMLTDITEHLDIGNQVEVTFTFEQAGDLTVQVPVVEPGTLPASTTTPTDN